MQIETKKAWVGGVAAGLAAGFTASKSQASIVPTTDMPQTVNASNPSASIDFVGEGDPPFSIDYDDTNGLTLQKQTEGTFPGAIESSSGVVAALPYGESIDDSDTFTGEEPPASEELNNGDGSTGQFVLSGSPAIQYIGVEFAPDTIYAPDDYGWIGFEVTDDSSLADLSGIVTGYAYDNSGAGITAGAVPEPSSLMLLALGAVGLAGYRRRSPVRARS